MLGSGTGMARTVHSKAGKIVPSTRIYSVRCVIFNLFSKFPALLCMPGLSRIRVLACLARKRCSFLGEAVAMLVSLRRVSRSTNNGHKAHMLLVTVC
jgi:hypothetical protein